MSKDVKRIDVIYKDPNATYRAGDVVSGNVVLELANELKVKGVRLVVHGISRVHWDEERAYTKGSSSKMSHKNVDVYLDELVVLVSRTDTLRAGRHSWPFSVRLPPYIPATFEGQNGRVMYWAKLVLERPWKGDIEHTKNFTVLGQLDLNTEPDAKKPIEGSGDVMVGLCCKSGPITGNIYLERRGFVSGQNIPFTAKIENNSKKKISVRVVLSQQAVFRADKQVRRCNTLLKGITKGDISPGDDLEIEDEIKNIPAVPPSRLGGGCKNIELKYLLTLVVVPSGPGKDLDVPVEVIIGTIPLRKIDTGGTPKLTVKAAAKMEPSPQPSGKKSPRLHIQ